MTIASDTAALRAALETYEQEVATFQRGTKAASTRARNALSTIGKLAKSLRADIQKEVNDKVAKTAAGVR